jgi:hypothetical protein
MLSNGTVQMIAKSTRIMMAVQVSGKMISPSSVQDWDRGLRDGIVSMWGLEPFIKAPFNALWQPKKNLVSGALGTGPGKENTDWQELVIYCSFGYSSLMVHKVYIASWAYSLYRLLFVVDTLLILKPLLSQFKV